MPHSTRPARASGRAAAACKVQWMRDDEIRVGSLRPGHGPELARGTRRSRQHRRLASTALEQRAQQQTRTRGGSGPRGGLHLARPHERPSAITSRFPRRADRNAIPIYDFPNQRVVNHYVTRDDRADLGAALAGCRRQPCLRTNPSWTELAQAAGIDPMLSACGTLRIRAVAPS